MREAFAFLRRVVASRCISRLKGSMSYDVDDEWIAVSFEALPLTDGDARVLRCLPRCNDINLSHSTITDRYLDTLSSFTHLRVITIDLSHTKITDAGLAAVGRMSHLVWLSVCGTSVSNDGIRFLGQLGSLRKLHAVQTSVTEDGITWLQQRLPKLQVNIVSNPYLRRAHENPTESDTAR